MMMVVSFSAFSQIYVKIRPTFPVVVRSQQPSRSAVWIDEDWQSRRGRYVYRGGRWANPPHSNYEWAPGSWQRHGERGEGWKKGHWKKRR